jgi:hypothetical protein
VSVESGTASPSKFHAGGVFIATSSADIAYRQAKTSLVPLHCALRTKASPCKVHGCRVHTHCETEPFTAKVVVVVVMVVVVVVVVVLEVVVVVAVVTVTAMLQCMLCTHLAST